MSGQIQLIQQLPPQPQQQPQQQPPQQQLQQAVRAWVHFDNLSSNLSKQASNARSQKQIHEKEIQNILIHMKQQHAVLEVNGARLQFQQKESKSNLSWSWLQDQLRAWFSSPEARNTKMPADDLVRFLQGRRTIKIAETLEKF